MSNFTNFAFAATGAPTNRTLPDRLAEIKNVKDFGAKGDGVTDDLPAIMAAFNWTTSSNRGRLYFPPGTYYVSGPIDISQDLSFVGILGHAGASTISGNFGDYVIKRYRADGAAWSGGHTVEGLTIINSHASGGGIRMGACVGAAIRDCDITANFGINTVNIDTVLDGAYWGSLELAIDNCNLRAYNALASGSFGIARSANGSTTNCTFKNFDTGMRTLGGQGTMPVYGCSFETNNYGLANNWAPGQSTWNTAGAATGGIAALGCHFKNNGTGILSTAGSSTYSGIFIEAAEGAIAGNPQYGIYAPSGGSCLFAGVRITGQYEVAGFALIGGDSLRNSCLIAGVSVSNASTAPGAKAWLMPSTAGSGEFVGCNVAPVFTMAELPAIPIGINTISWSGGTTTLSLFRNMLPYMGGAITIAVEGVSPSGYNGSFSDVTVTGVDTVSYSQADPGSPIGGGGTAVVNVNASAQEGDCYSISDSDVATWGGNPVGGGSTHAKVRWNGTNWSVIGA